MKELVAKISKIFAEFGIVSKEGIVKGQEDKILFAQKSKKKDDKLQSLLQILITITPDD